MAMRVVYLTHVARPSGAELSLLRVIDALGHRVEAHVWLGERGPLADLLTNVGAQVQVMPLADQARDVRRAGISANGASLRAVGMTSRYSRQLAGELRRLRPDLVHTVSLKSAIYGGVAARLAHVPQVWGLHDIIGQDELGRPAAVGVRALTRVLPAIVLAPSQANLDSIPWASHTRVVPAPIEQDVPRAAPPTGPVHHVGVVGRLAPWKGQHIALRAFALAYANDAGLRHLHIIGSPMFGEQSYEQDLHRLTENLGIAEQVTFHGFVDPVTDAFAQLDLVLHTSVQPEPFGQVIVQAMAAGVAVIAADAGGPREIVTPGVNGLLTTPGDPNALAAAMMTLDDPARRQQLVEAGLVRGSDFTPEAAAAAVMDAYTDVLNRQRARSPGKTRSLSR